MADLIALLIVLIPLFLIYIIFRPKEQGTLQERRNNPELNTNTLDLHYDRLDKFSKSKFKGDMYYIGPRGGYYYYQNGRKVYL